MSARNVGNPLVRRRLAEDGKEPRRATGVAVQLSGLLLVLPQSAPAAVDALTLWFTAMMPTLRGLTAGECPALLVEELRGVAVQDHVRRPATAGCAAHLAV